MLHLEELTLYLSFENRAKFVDGTHLHNEILIHMPQLHPFIFYICTRVDIADSVHQLSNDDIQQTFNKVEYQRVNCIRSDGISHVFSLPFSFDRSEWIGNTLPTILLLYWCAIRFPKHEFFIRIARCFPSLKNFYVINSKSQLWYGEKMLSDDKQSYSVVEYSHLTSLDIMYVNADYVDQFLNKKKTCLPRLTELRVHYPQMATVTAKFKRDTMRLNCVNVNWLILETTIMQPAPFYFYFPWL